MNILRKLGLGLLSPLFVFLLFATAFDIGFVNTATHPETVKKIISDSGLYNSIVPNILQQTKSIETPLGSFPTSEPIIKNAVNQAVTPQYVRQNAEAAIDDIYQWLDGKVGEPTFKFDLTGPSNNFADSVGTYVQQRISALPACTNSQNLQFLQGGQLDINNLSCLPKGIDSQSIAGQVKSSLAESGFLNNVNLSADSIKGSGNQPFFQTDTVKQVPKQYQRAKKTPLILSVLTVLTGIGIVFLSKTWQKGLRHVGINLVVIGLVMLIFSWALNKTVSTKVIPKIKVDNAIFQQDIRNLATDLTQQIDKNYWYFGGIYTVIGAGSIAAAEIFRRRLTAADIDASAKHPGQSGINKHGHQGVDLEP